MSSEDLVVDAVCEHFADPRYNRYTVKQEHPIRIGSQNARADVVLIDSTGNCAAIVECKGIGYENGGIDQLKSYLAASATSLGIFANSTNSDDWKYYKHLGANQWREIPLSEFEAQLLRTGIIETVTNFLKRMFGRRQAITPTVSHDPPADSPVRHYPHIPYTNTTGGFPLVQNEDRVAGGVEPSLNGEPYYSNENGFYWATNHRGMAECIPQHIRQIIHNEEIEIVSSQGNLENEIERLHNTKSERLSEKEGVEQEISLKENEKARKEEEYIGLELVSKAPTPTELVATDEPPPVKQSKWSLVARSVVPLITTLVLLGSMCYLFIFYASAGDKAFSRGEGSVEQQLNEIINPYAFIQALEKGNWFAPLFPCLFVLLAMVVHFAYVHRRWLLVGVPLLITLGLDIVIALKIALNVRDDKVARDLPPDADEIFLLNIITVLLLGLAISVLWSIGFHWVTELWKKVKISQDHRNDEMREKQIGKERIDRDAQLAAAGKTIENMDRQLQNLRESSAAIQQIINEVEAAIGRLSTYRYSRVVNRNKIELQVQEFLSGWCRFVAHSENGGSNGQGGSNVSAQIQRVNEAAQETLSQYYEALRDNALNRGDAPLQ